MYPFLQEYVKDIVRTYANDDRILMWDLYNEPGNSKHEETSLPLLTNEERHGECIKFLKMLNRPLICTEYMARRNDSRFCNVLPLMKKEKVGAINWGFVAGKTNTIFAWDDVIPSGEEPELWFHDIYRPTGVPYQQEEVDCIQSLTGKR